MVSTRGSRPAASGKAAQDASDAPGSGVRSELSSVQAIEASSGIGTRLRKRRRTGSSPTNTPSKVAKSASKSPELQRLETTSARKAASPSQGYSDLDEDQPSDTLDAMLQDATGHTGASSEPAKVGVDFQGAIDGIIDHATSVEKAYQGQHISSDGSALEDPEAYVSVDANLHLKIQSLPILDNLSTQILSTLAKATYQEIISLISEPQSDSGQAYQTLKSLFDHTKKVYSIHEPFISASDLGLTDMEHIKIIRKANLATFVSSVFGCSDVGFFHLNEFFLDTFVPEGSRLLKSQGQLFLELKTQAYISAMTSGDRSRPEILYDLFPEDLEQRLLSRRPGARGPAPSESDFVKRAHSRRDYLLREINNDAVIAGLPQKYRWEDFLKEISDYIGRHLNNELTGTQPQDRKPKMRSSITNGESQEVPQIEFENKFAVKSGLTGGAQEVNNQEDMVERAARAARIALQNNTAASMQLSPQPVQHNSQSPLPQAQMHTTFQEYTYPPPPDSTNRPPNHNLSFGDVPEIPYHTQSAPTQVLYERARQAATAKASPTSRRAGLPSQRRPWSTEEENALMAGLDRVKGPHWSQILAMFGPGGTINETLKDRNQVQLKDKARNLKLFFLKSGIEVPYYLQFVTGELKTRAPAQAAKNEAKEREMSSFDDDKAHFEGVMGIVGLANASRADDGTEETTMLENGSAETFTSPGAQLQEFASQANQPEHIMEPVRQQPHRSVITGGVTTT